MGPTNAWWSSCEGDKYTGCRHGCLSISVGSFLSLRSLFFLAPLSPCISIFDYCVGYLYQFLTLELWHQVSTTYQICWHIYRHLWKFCLRIYKLESPPKSRWLTDYYPPRLKWQRSVKDFMTNHYLHHFHFHTLKNSSKSYVWQNNILVVPPLHLHSRHHNNAPLPKKMENM